MSVMQTRASERASAKDESTGECWQRRDVDESTVSEASAVEADATTTTRGRTLPCGRFEKELTLDH